MLFHSYIVPSRGVGKYTLTLLWSFKDICELPVLDVCWNPKSQKILAACYGDRDKDEGVLCVWNVKNPHTPERRIKNATNINCLAFTKTRPDILAYACLDGSVSYVDITSNLPNPVDLQKSEHGHWPIWGITWVTLEEIGKVCYKLMTCDDMGEINLWNLEDKTSTKLEEITFIPTPNKYLDFQNVKKEFPFRETFLPCYWITPHPVDRRTYYVGTYTGAIATCKTLSVCGKRELWKAHNGAVLGMKFSPFTHLVFLTYGLDGYLNIWVDGIPEPVHQISHLPHYIIGGEWSPTHSTILFTLTYEELKVWNLIKTDGKYQACVKYERFTCMAVSNTGMNVAAGTEDGNILVYKLNDLPHPPCRQVEVLKKSLKHYAYYDKDVVKKINAILKTEGPDQKEDQEIRKE
ncbi:dynein axonemal intermediate chain 4-like [Rhodnius prolixus]|uniref:dynein axonemal intermediate chain 4-like n=1 Tax=Rhodnius prolixus TaxID=13249 RepID=UPI003D18C758